MRKQKRYVVKVYIPEERLWVNVFKNGRTYKREINAEKRAAFFVDLLRTRVVSVFVRVK